MCDAWCNMIGSAHPTRDLLAARRLGAHAFERRAQQLGHGRGWEPRDRVRDHAGVAHGQTPLDQRAVLRRERLREEHRQRIRARRPLRVVDVAQRVADGARERVVRVRISASRFCRKPSLRVPGALAQCLAVGAVFGRDRVRRVILLFSLATRVFLVAAAAAAGHLGRGVHHHRGRAGWCVGTGGIAESRAGIVRRKLGSVSRDSSGWIARPRRQETRGVERTSRHDGVRSAIRERRVSRRGPGGPLDGTNEGRPGVDCRGPMLSR